MDMNENEVRERLRSRYGIGPANQVMRTYKRLLKHGGYSAWDEVSDNHLDIGGRWNQDHLIALQLAGVPIQARRAEPGREYYYWYSYEGYGGKGGRVIGMEGPLGMTLQAAQQGAPGMLLSGPRFSRHKLWSQFNSDLGNVGA